MDIGIVIEGAAGRAAQLNLPDAPRVTTWIIELDTPVFILPIRAAGSSWYSQFAITSAPVDLLTPGSAMIPDERRSHRLAVAPLAKPYYWGEGKPVISTAFLFAVDYVAPDDPAAFALVRALAGACAGGLLPVGGRHPRMAWHGAVAACSVLLEQSRAEVQS